MYLLLVQGGFVCKWADDSQRLILEHFDTVYKSPSKIYDYALPLSPPSSWLHKYYTAELLHGFKVIKGPKSEWGACSRSVLPMSYTLTLSYWDNIIVVGSVCGDIAILDAITGSEMAYLSGHTDEVSCLTFSSDGKSLVSGSDDKTVKLWDMQTGGVVRTLHGHTDLVLSVSISADCTRIVSGSKDNTIRLWDTQMGECLCIIKQEDTVSHVRFSPIDPQHIISISSDKVWQWDVNGHQILPTYDGTHITFSPDHTQFALCNGKVVTVQNSDSRAIVAEFHMANDDAKHCCFSPDGRLIAAAAGRIAYAWDITSPDPHPIETFVGHTCDITSLVFSSPSSLISSSYDDLVKFWQIVALSTDLVAVDQQPTPFPLPGISSVSLQAKAGIAVSSDEDGVVKTWDISTGLCKASFQIPDAKYIDRGQGDAKLIDGRLIFAWHMDDEIHIWDAGKGELLQTLDAFQCKDLRISGDGSKIFGLLGRSIQAWSIWSWEPVGKVEVGLEGTLHLDPFCMDDSKVWVHSRDSSAKEGWNFGTSGSPPVLLGPSTGRPHLDLIGSVYWQTDGPSWIKDPVTGKEVFQLSGEDVELAGVQWDGRYLVAGYRSGEVLILDFDVLSRDM